MFKQLIYYAQYSWSFFILKQQPPLILGLVITDKCNLACKSCRVANTGRPDLTLAQIIDKLETFYRRGYRELYLEGGEPFLWKDGVFTLEDIVDRAYQIGFFHVHVYTNGLFPLASKADTFWVSLDGLRAKNALVRGDHFDRVICNIKNSRHRRIAIIYTVNHINKGDINPFLSHVKDEKLNTIGVMFYFHTPYYGRDELFIDFDERSKIIAEIINLKKKGYPVFNSLAGLRALQTGNWQRPTKVSAITDIDGDHICCRYNSVETCKECGFAACAELTEAQRLKPSAIANLCKFW